MKYSVTYINLNEGNISIFKGWNEPKFLVFNPLWRSFYCWITPYKKIYPLEELNIAETFPELKDIWPELIKNCQHYTIHITLYQPIKNGL